MVSAVLEDESEVCKKKSTQIRRIGLWAVGCGNADPMPEKKMEGTWLDRDDSTA